MSKVTMPEPAMTTFDYGSQQRYYTAEQMETYAAAKVREALEAAIEICDAAYEQGRSEYSASCNPYFEGGCDVADSIGSKIRALIPPLPGLASHNL